MLGGAATLLGAGFTAAPVEPMRLPVVRQIPLPAFPGAHAIWGAIAPDNAGGIWAGISADGGAKSAHLVRLDPVSGVVANHGDVLGQLARLGGRPPGESQVKIHSKIIQPGDGHFYFTSTDEDGEAEDGSAPPRWGSHLWRLRADGGAWEHLLAVPEGLTCAAGAGRTIWALGLWDHVLYRYDIPSGAVRRVVVAAPGGHMSRNIVADVRGHAYVPRVRQAADGSITADLLEFAPDMTVLAETPLLNYAIGQTASTAHGIIGLVNLADGGIAITTGAGAVHHIAPRADGPAVVTALGWFHPAGRAYAPCLFTWDGVRTLAGLAQVRDWEWDWVVFDLASRTSRAARLGIPPESRPLLYGSDTRDAAGRFYVAGRHATPEGRGPILLQLDTGP